MSSEKRFELSKDDIDRYLKETAREYRRLEGKKMPAEIIMIGGASILINYGFRDSTVDIDALIHAASCMDDAVRLIRDRYDLPDGWLNSDFSKTASYSDKLWEYSVYYRTYSNVMTIRTITAEYLIAMKLRAGRQYKNDLSDVLGILAEHEKRNSPVTMEKIRKAVTDLYGSWDSLPEASRIFIENVMANGQFEEAYRQVRNGEKETRELMIRFEADHPGIMKTSNAEEITAELQKKADRASILQELRRRKVGSK